MYCNGELCDIRKDRNVQQTLLCISTIKYNDINITEVTEEWYNERNAKETLWNNRNMRKAFKTLYYEPCITVYNRVRYNENLFITIPLFLSDYTYIQILLGE